jgi:hypothetical protein
LKCTQLIVLDAARLYQFVHGKPLGQGITPRLRPA